MKLQENRHIEIQKGKEVGPDRPSTYPTRPNQIHKGWIASLFIIRETVMGFHKIHKGCGYLGGVGLVG